MHQVIFWTAKKLFHSTKILRHPESDEVVVIVKKSIAVQTYDRSRILSENVFSSSEKQIQPSNNCEDSDLDIESFWLPFALDENFKTVSIK